MNFFRKCFHIISIIKADTAVRIELNEKPECENISIIAIVFDKTEIFASIEN